MEERQAKLRRLASVGIAHSKLVALLDKLRNDPLLPSDVVNKQSLSRAVLVLFEELGYTEVLAGTNCEITWDCLSFPLVLQYMVKKFKSFRNVAGDLWTKRPCSALNPYSLVMFADEVTPGNVLRLDNKRKTLCIYVTIREFGSRYIKDEKCWLPIAAIRSVVAKGVLGGQSACVAMILDRMFIRDRIRDDGILLDLGGGRHVNLFFQLGNIIADVEGHRAIWSAKGASGKLPCLLCLNVLSEHVESDYLVHFSCADADLFDIASDSDIWKKADILESESRTATKKAFDRLQMVHGLTYSPHGLLWSMPLRRYVSPTTCITYDSMHCIMSNGIGQFEVGLLLGGLKTIGTSWEHVRDFATADWHFPSAIGRKSLGDVFGKPREEAWKRDLSIKAGAAELLSALPVLLHFLHKVIAPKGVLDLQTKSLTLLGWVVDLVRRGKDGQDCHVDLRTAIRQHAEMMSRAYPEAEKNRNITTPCIWPSNCRSTGRSLMPSWVSESMA